MREIKEGRTRITLLVGAYGFTNASKCESRIDRGLLFIIINV